MSDPSPFHRPLGAQNPRQPVRSLGKKDPANLVEKILGSVVPSANGGMTMNPEAFKNAPPWVLELMNGVQNCITEVQVLKVALFRRGILTEPELQEAAIILNKTNEEVFKTMLAGLERTMNQQPNVDPRTSPK